MKLLWIIPLLLMATLSFGITEERRQELLRQAPSHYTEVALEFQRYLRREPTDAEKLHFGALLADGYKISDIDAVLLKTQDYQNRILAEAQRPAPVCSSHENGFLNVLSVVSPILAAVIP